MAHVRVTRDASFYYGGKRTTVVEGQEFTGRFGEHLRRAFPDFEVLKVSEQILQAEAAAAEAAEAERAASAQRAVADAEAAAQAAAERAAALAERAAETAAAVAATEAAATSDDDPDDEE